MKQLKIILICSLFLLLPRSVYALDGELSITCDSPGLYKTKDVNCTISGTTDEVISGLKGELTFSEDITISNFAFTSNWLNITAVQTITSGMDIEAIASAEQGSEDIIGDFTVATFKARLADEAVSSNQEITISSIEFYDANVNTVTIEDDATVSFEDFMEISEYTIDDEKHIIYRLNPMTVGTFKQNISTNVFFGIYDDENHLIDDELPLETGHFFKTTFMNVPRIYKISVLGDVLGEGLPTINGAKTVARHIIDGNVLTEDEELLSADMDDDSEIKMNDVMRMLSEMVG